MFKLTSSLRELQEAFSQNIGHSEYFLGLHAFFEGEVIFARDVVHLNLELPQFPVDVDASWAWLRDNLRGPKEQETFVYELPFAIDSEEDQDMEALVELSRRSPMTVWMVDLAQQESPQAGRRYAVITIPTKQGARNFKSEYHDTDGAALLK